MLVDHEALLLDLKRHLVTKNSHGQRDLLGLIAHLEVAHAVEEGVPERALRLYGADLAEALRRSDEPTTGGPAGDHGHGAEAHSLTGRNGHNEEDHHGSQHRNAA